MTSRWEWMNWPAKARWALTACYWLLVNWMLFAPSGNFKHVHFFPQQDKLGHLALFGALAALVRWSIPLGWGRGWKRIAVAAAVIGYGVATECIQPRISGAGRAFEWLDIAMDSLGGVFGLWLCGRLERRTPESGGWAG